MKKRVFRYASVIALVFVIGFGMMVGSAQASAAKKSVTIHVKNNIKWKKVCIYTYDGDGEIAGSWPGKVMKKNKKCKGWLDYTFKTGSELNLVFNSGSKKGPQTNDIKHVKNNKKEYWVQITGGKSKNPMGVSVGGSAKLLKKAPAAYTKALKKTSKK